MPPALASLVFTIGIAGLFILDDDRDSRTSRAIWIPVVWMSIGASRMVSQWFEVGMTTSADQYLEGSPVDRLIVGALLAAGLTVLVLRARQSSALLRANGPLVLFVLYCAISVLWSDYPGVAFKRWVKALGNVVMVFVVLTDPQPDKAAKRLLAWAGFLLIPYSILLIKYYPEFGRGYDRWLGTVSYGGVTEGKNLLGSDLLVFGLASLWCLIEAFRSKSTRQRIAHGTVFAMVLWLFLIVDSSTSLACFLLGAGLIATLTVFGSARPKRVHWLLGSMVVTVLVAFFVLDAYAFVVEALGRDASLTGRTELWAEVLTMTAHPLLGAGFESFFLGERLQYLWSKYWWHPNEAHNGYLEIYLNLGWIGITLLAIVFISGYRHVIEGFRGKSSLATLKLALFVIAITYNLTEAAFKVMHPVWIAFMLAIVALPKAAVRDPNEGNGRVQPRPEIRSAHQFRVVRR